MSAETSTTVSPRQNHNLEKIFLLCMVLFAFLNHAVTDGFMKRIRVFQVRKTEALPGSLNTGSWDADLFPSDEDSFDANGGEHDDLKHPAVVSLSDANAPKKSNTKETTLLRRTLPKGAIPVASLVPVAATEEATPAIKKQATRPLQERQAKEDSPSQARQAEQEPVKLHTIATTVGNGEKVNSDTNTKGSRPTKQDKPSVDKKPKRAESQQQLDRTINSNSTEPKPNTLKCATWKENLDEWWQEHPTWDVALENATHFCFAPIADPVRAELLRTIHQRQFPKDTKTACTGKKKIINKNVGNLGFAGNMYVFLQKRFYQAHREDKIFLPGIPSKTFQWIYAPTNATLCPTGKSDIECYFLPVTNCPRPLAEKDSAWRRFYDWELFGGSSKEYPINKTLQEHSLWLGNYLTRPRQQIRHQLYNYLHDKAGNTGVPTLPKNSNCTWIHVRRGDAMTEAGYDRNFYSIQDYLKLGKIKKEETILLLTDDESSIEEATLLHPEYNWVYFNRTRNRGPVPLNSHIPSHDPFQEVLVLLAEQKVAAQCQKGVYGKSNMLKLFQAGMIRHHHLEDLEMVEMDRRLKKTRVEAQDFMKDLNKRLDVVRKQTKQRV